MELNSEVEEVKKNLDSEFIQAISTPPTTTERKISISTNYKSVERVLLSEVKSSKQKVDLVMQKYKSEMGPYASAMLEVTLQKPREKQ